MRELTAGLANDGDYTTPETVTQTTFIQPPDRRRDHMRDFVRAVAGADHGSSGQGCLG